MFYQIVMKLSARLSLQSAVLDIHKTEWKEILVCYYISFLLCQISECIITTPFISLLSFFLMKCHKLYTVLQSFIHVFV